MGTHEAEYEDASLMHIRDLGTLDARLLLPSLGLAGPDSALAPWHPHARSSLCRALRGGPPAALLPAEPAARMLVVWVSFQLSGCTGRWITQASGRVTEQHECAQMVPMK